MKFADDLDHRLNILHWSFRQNAMPKIHNVPRAHAGAPQQLSYFGSKLRQGSEESGRIQVSLNCRAISDIHPGLIDVDTPIHSNHIAASGMQLPEKSTGTGSEMNDRHTRGTNLFDKRSRIRLNIAGIVLGAEGA